MTAFLIIAFILASNGTHSMIITSNEIYRINKDNIIKYRKMKKGEEQMKKQNGITFINLVDKNGKLKDMKGTIKFIGGDAGGFVSDLQDYLGTKVKFVNKKG